MGNKKSAVRSARRALAWPIAAREHDDDFRLDWEVYSDAHAELTTSKAMMRGFPDGAVSPGEPVYDLDHDTRRRIEVFRRTLAPVIAEARPRVVFATVTDGRGFDHQIVVFWSGRKLYWYDPNVAFYLDDRFRFGLNKALRGAELVVPGPGARGVQSLLKNDSCMFLAKWAAMRLLEARDPDAEFAALHDVRSLRTRTVMDDVIRVARTAFDTPIPE